MNRQILSSLTLVLASLAAAPVSVAAQTYSFGSATPVVVAKDSTPSKPDAKPAAKDSVPPKPEFKPSWNFSTWIFGSYSYQTDSTTKAANNDAPTSKFSVDRAYLTFRGQVAPDWGFRVTTDVFTVGGVGTYTGLAIRLKYAWMQWDFAHAAEPNDLSAFARIGQITTVVIDDEEHYWARWIQKTAVEFWGIQPASSDLGVGAQVNLPGKWGAVVGVLDNGGGYTVATDADRYKDAALRLSLTPLMKGNSLLKTFELSGWYQAGRTQGPGIAPGYKPGLDNNAYGVYIGNADPRLQFGLEYAARLTQSVVPTDSSILDNTAKLTDGFVIIRPFLFADPKGLPLGVILRYDNYQPNDKVSTKMNLFIATVFLDVAKSSSLGISYQGQTQSSPSNVLAEKTFWQLNYQITF
jgi:hypothetical protein